MNHGCSQEAGHELHSNFDFLSPLFLVQLLTYSAAARSQLVGCLSRSRGIPIRDDDEVGKGRRAHVI